MDNSTTVFPASGPHSKNHERCLPDTVSGNGACANPLSVVAVSTLLNEVLDYDDLQFPAPYAPVVKPISPTPVATSQLEKGEVIDSHLQPTIRAARLM